MHVLTVVSHPNPGSFTHAVAQAFNRGAVEAGHTVELADLHAEGFDPTWSMADVTQFEDGGATPADVLAEQARIERCHAVCMAFPLFWFGMPAMMKGWVDRVWTYGWAYETVGDPHASLQPDRIGVLLIPAGAAAETWTPYGLGPAMETIWRTGTMGYFGLSDQRVHILNGAEGSAERRAGLLARAYAVGAGLDRRSEE